LIQLYKNPLIATRDESYQNYLRVKDNDFSSLGDMDSERIFFHSLKESIQGNFGFLVEISSLAIEL
jgi:hypothetical protein